MADNNGFKEDIKKLWNKVPTFKKYKNTIPVIHIPLKRSLIESALTNSNFRINYKNKIDNFYFL